MYPRLLWFVLLGLVLSVQAQPQLPDPPYILEGPVYSYGSPPLSPNWFQGETTLRILLPKGERIPSWTAAFVRQGWRLEVREITAASPTTRLAWGNLWVLIPSPQGWRWETKDMLLIGGIRGAYEVGAWQGARSITVR